MFGAYLQAGSAALLFMTEHADRIEWKKQSDCDVERAQSRNQNAVERR